MPHTAVLLLRFAAASALLLVLIRLFTQARGSFLMYRTLRVDRRERATDMSVIAAYHNRSPHETRDEPLDDRTWGDLDLDEVFAELDHTQSELGRQYLYHLLRSPRFSVEPLSRLEQAVGAFTSNAELGGRVRTALAKLSDPRSAYLEELFFGVIPPRPRFWWLFPILTASAVTCLALIVIWPPLFAVWVGICVVNVAVQVFYKPRVQHLIPALHEVPTFLRTASALGELQVPEIAGELAILREGGGPLGRLRLATSWLAFEPGQASDVAGTIYEYFNLLFLLNMNAFVFATTALREANGVARSMFEALGYIDTAQSISAWRASRSDWCEPAFAAARKAMHVENLAHPLLTAAVPNSLEFEGQSVLITGSNMSGKTTFIRTIGVNAVLAQTVHTVCATRWTAPMFHVRTSIGRADSLMDGKSYYMAEVESVLGLVRAKESGHQHLFLLDEVFRGTNTTERVAAACAVLALEHGRRCCGRRHA